MSIFMLALKTDIYELDRYVKNIWKNIMIPYKQFSVRVVGAPSVPGDHRVEPWRARHGARVATGSFISQVSPVTGLSWDPTLPANTDNLFIFNNSYEALDINIMGCVFSKHDNNEKNDNKLGLLDQQKQFINNNEHQVEGSNISY